MVIGDTTDGNAITMAHPSGIPQEKIDNIMSGISNTGAVKMNNHRKKLRQRFDIIKKLGQGTYGKVQLGINKETGQEVAIKTIKKCKIEAEADLIRIRREVQIMSSVQHPNIIHIYEVFENREKMVLVMEFAAGGELYDYLSERKVLAEEEARRIFRQVATAVYYCHKHKICHRDLKLENILLDENGNAKIADFGLSNVFDEQRLLATFCGSPLYASPEIVKGTPYLGPEVDCWSLGVLLYTLVYGSMPFDGSNFKRLVKQISQGDYFEPKKPSRASPLIKDMLTVCPRKRSTIESICNHWWVNEGNEESCLDLAETLANQTPVRLDVLLSLSPVSVTADQLVVPSIDPVVKSSDRVPRSHSVGSIRDIPPNTEAERRILDMVAAGGEAALMPSPTRTITPVQSPVQTKRKLENTMSMNNSVDAIKKKEKPADPVQTAASEKKPNSMDVDIDEKELKILAAATNNEQSVEDKCDQIIEDPSVSQPEVTLTPKLIVEEEVQSNIARQKTLTKLDAVREAEEIQEELSPPKVVKKFINKHKTADLISAINKISPEKSDEFQKSGSAVRKNSLPDESIGKFNTERRRSRILETAEKFQNMNNSSIEKPKKFVIPGVSVGNFKKEFERKASLTTLPGLSSAERRILEKRSESVDPGTRKNSYEDTIEDPEVSTSPIIEKLPADIIPTVSKSITPPNKQPNLIAQKEPKENTDLNMSFTNFSLEEARRSMENSIALLNQAKNESSNEVDQLCAKTGNVSVSDIIADRERKLRNAREIIGNAIQPGIRKPSPFGINGRSISGGINLPTSPTIEKRQYRLGPSENSLASQTSIKPSPTPTDKNRTGPVVKTSRAEITLKSATLPRRKAAKSEIQLDIKPIIDEQSPMRFSTEMQHPIMDLRSAPVQEGTSPYSPLTSSVNNRSISLEPQLREHIIPIQRPPAYTRTSSNTTTRSGSLSRQSTNDSESDTTTNYSQSTITGSSQPIKKSPREFIIPIAVEGGGFITPRAGSIEPSESSQTTGSASTFSMIGRPPRRFGTLFSEADVEEDSPFQKKRNASIHKEGDDEPRFTMHRLRSTRPAKKPSSQDNDSQSSGEEDDDDGFEILTAENLFSTLLSRVRALTNRLNVNNDITTGFPSNSRVLNNIRQPHSSFWNQEPFGSRLNSASNIGAPWRHSMSRDLGTEMESMFNRAGATLPRGSKQTKSGKTPKVENESLAVNRTLSNMNNTDQHEPPLDLADLDLSRLRLSKKDLETLSCITPDLPKCFQEQLLAKLPPTQARKLSRTLSMKNNNKLNPVRIYKRSQSDGQELADEFRSHPKTFKDAKISDLPQEEVCDKNSNVLQHRSLTKSNDVTADCKNRCRVNDDSSKSLCSSFSSDISDKYKYYSPYLSKGRESDSSSISPYRRYDSLSPRDACLSPTKEVCGRPPNGCFSPPPLTPDSSLRRRPSQRRISRFLRPDFFDECNEESAYEKEKRCRERETQSVLREIRENSRDPSRDKLNQIVDLENISSRRTDNYNNKIDNYNENPPPSSKHTRNKSLERFCDANNDLENDLKRNRRRSLSKSRELDNDYLALTSQIIKELNNLSAVQRKKELTGNSMDIATTSIAHVANADIKKVKKTKLQDKLADPTVTTIESNNKETVVKKVKKIVKKLETNPKEDNFVSLEVSSSKVNMETLKRESKLKRPKSYPTKELEKHTGSNSCGSSMLSSTEKNHTNQIPKTVNDSEIIKETKLVRPKSFPNSKLTPPKEIKKSTKSGSTIPSVVEKFSEKSTTTIMARKSPDNRSSISEEKSTTTTKNSDSSSATDIKQIPTVKKLIKVSKKVKTTVSHVKKEEKKLNLKESSPSSVSQYKDKSPEKKSGKGIFYAIGQKLEKFRDSAKGKDKKLLVNGSTENIVGDHSSVDKHCIIKEKKVKTRDGCTKSEKKKDEKTDDVNLLTTKPDKRSRIDAMIRSLRERSVPKSSGITESGLIKRAVSVEDMPGTFNKNGVNKVLGLFKKIEKDRGGQKVMSTRSTSNIDRKFCESPSPNHQRDRPKSSDFFTKPKKNVIFAVNQNKDSSTADICFSALPKSNGSVTNFTGLCPQTKYSTCPDCIQEQTIESVAMASKRYYDKEKTETVEGKNEIKDRRKGLMLDFTKLDSLDNLKSNRANSMINGNGNYLNSSHTSGDITGLNYKNNNINSSFNLSSHEINQNCVYTPSSDNIANYSSDSRSYQDECASNSTFLSPTEEPELCFDNWSICSEDNFALHTPSPTMPRLSRNSQYSSPTSLLGSDKTESMNDRIKRRSFYCRFNENKPKRQSNIVGQSARDYYRETEAKHRLRPERIASSEILNSRSTNEFLKPLKLSSAGSELKPPIYKTPPLTMTFNNLDYSKPRKSLNDFNSTSPSALPKRYSHVDNDYPLRHRNASTKTSTVYTTCSSPPNYYNSYNPKRRSSYTLLNGGTLSSSSNIDSYATVGRRTIRPYDHRSISLLDSTIQHAANTSASSSALGTSTYRRDHRTPSRDTTNLTRSNLNHYRSPSLTRSPTDI